MSASKKDAMLILQAQQAMGASDEAQAFIWGDQMVEDGEEFFSKYPLGSVEAGYVNQVARFFETIGTFWKHGLVDEGFLFDWLTCVAAWDRLEGVLLEQRKRLGDARLWENFEALTEAQRPKK